MSRLNSIICPLGKGKIDLLQSRVIVFVTALLMMFFLYTENPIYMIIATLDTCIRAFLKPKSSPFGMIIAKLFALMDRQVITVNLAKKQFAARLGALCGLSSLLLFYFGFQLGAIVMTSFWMVLALLDALLNACLGCVIYSSLVLPFYTRQ